MKTTIIPEILRFESNTNFTNFNYFSLGEVVSKNLFKSGNEKYSVTINFVNKPEDHFEEDMENFSSFYKVGKSSIFVKRTYANMNCSMLVCGMDTNNIRILVNKAYYKLIRFKVDNLYPPALHANDILMTKMISDGDLVLHGASFTPPKSDAGFIIIAPPDTGKTYTAFKLLEKGYGFLGEDLSYYSGKKDALLCMPLTSTWGHHFEKNKKIKDRIPFIQLFMDQQKNTAADLFSDEVIKISGSMSRIYLMEKSPLNKVIAVKPDKKIISQLISIQRNEFSYFKNPLIRAYEYFNMTNIDRLYMKEADNLEKLFREKQLYKVYADKYDSFYPLIDKHIKSNPVD